MEGGDADEEIRVQRVGLVDGTDLSAGRLYYLSQTTAGELTADEDVTVADEGFTAALDVATSLAYEAIIDDSETVTSSDGGTGYTANSDYEMDYEAGTITPLSTGSMTAGDYLIGYDYSPITVRPQLMGYAASSTELFIVCGLNDLALVHIEGNEQIGGTKTFTTLPQVSSYRVPTDDKQFATKKYVDDVSALQTNATTINGVTVDGDDIGDGKILQYNEDTGNLEYESLPSGTDAGSICGVTVNDASIADGYVLKYDAGTETLKYEEDSGATGSGVTAAQAKKYAIIFG